MTEEEREICERYEAGESIRSLADCYGTSQYAVRKILAAHGVEVRGQGWPSKEPTSACSVAAAGAIARLYESGSSLREIADVVGCSHEQVRLVLEQYGVERRPLVQRALEPGTEEFEEAVQLFEAGLSLVEVGERVGVSAKTVGKSLRAAGIDTRWWKRGRG